jgi:hypothetical protein
MLLFHHFLSEEDLDWPKSFENDGLSEDEMKAMISAREVGAIDNSTYRAINRGSDTNASDQRASDRVTLYGAGVWSLKNLLLCETRVAKTCSESRRHLNVGLAEEGQLPFQTNHKKEVRC